MFPQEISKIELSKMQFPAFAGLELDYQESLLSQKNEYAHNKMKYLKFGNYNYWFAVVCFSVDSKLNSNQKECMNP